MRIFLITIILMVGWSYTSTAQGFIFGPKGGATFGIQNWNGFDREPLIAYHGAIYIESLNRNSLSSLYTQFGYHKRGSSEDVFFFTGGGTGFRERQRFEFNNLALQFGAKRKVDSSSGNHLYYSFGFRLDYTLSHNLDQYEIYAGYFPISPYVNKFNYGASVALGYEYNFSNLSGVIIEASIHPDFSRQYEQPGGFSIISPITGQGISLREQSIRNITFELSVGLKLVREIIYLDD